MAGYPSRVVRRFVGWQDDAFFSFRWWDIPAAVWFALFGPRAAGE